MKRRNFVVVVFGLAMLLGMSLTFLMLLHLQRDSRTLTLSAERPVWTASITGDAGDVAEIWIWTATATLRTNLPVPVTLKLDRKSLLLAARSRDNRDLMVHMSTGSQGSAHVPLKAGQTNTAVVVSRNWIPGMPIDFFMATTFPPGATMEVMPVYGPFWGPRTVGFAEVKSSGRSNASQPSP
jgi:hypothetical protein